MPDRLRSRDVKELFETAVDQEVLSLGVLEIHDGRRVVHDGLEARLAIRQGVEVRLHLPRRLLHPLRQFVAIEGHTRDHQDDEDGDDELKPPQRSRHGKLLIQVRLLNLAHLITKVRQRPVDFSIFAIHDGHALAGPLPLIVAEVGEDQIGLCDHVLHRRVHRVERRQQFACLSLSNIPYQLLTDRRSQLIEDGQLLS